MHVRVRVRDGGNFKANRRGQSVVGKTFKEVRRTKPGSEKVLKDSEKGVLRTLLRTTPNQNV